MEVLIEVGSIESLLYWMGGWFGGWLDVSTKIINILTQVEVGDELLKT